MFWSNFYTNLIISVAKTQSFAFKNQQFLFLKVTKKLESTHWVFNISSKFTKQIFSILHDLFHFSQSLSLERFSSCRFWYRVDHVALRASATQVFLPLSPLFPLVQTEYHFPKYLTFTFYSSFLLCKLFDTQLSLTVKRKQSNYGDRTTDQLHRKCRI